MRSTVKHCDVELWHTLYRFYQAPVDVLSPEDFLQSAVIDHTPVAQSRVTQQLLQDGTSARQLMTTVMQRLVDPGPARVEGMDIKGEAVELHAQHIPRQRVEFAPLLQVSLNQAEEGLPAVKTRQAVSGRQGRGHIVILHYRLVIETDTLHMGAQADVHEHILAGQDLASRWINVIAPHLAAAQVAP